MAGVWVFENGLPRLVERDHLNSALRKALLHIPDNEIITSYSCLEDKLLAVGWERYYENPSLLQFHRPPSIDLISLPKRFSDFKSMYMYDIVVKNRGIFKVTDVPRTS